MYFITIKDLYLLKTKKKGIIVKKMNVGEL